MTICAITVRCKDRRRFQHHLDICQDSQQNGLTHRAIIQARIGVKHHLGRVVVLARASLVKSRSVMLRSMLLGTMLGMMRAATIGALVNMLKVGMYIGLVMISALTSQCSHITAHQNSDIEHKHQEC
jgi:hypothetical protein